MAAEQEDKKIKRPTALKRDLQNEKRRDINRQFKSKVRTAIRNFEESEKAGNTEQSNERLKAIYSLMDKGVKRGTFKRNKASRTKARFCARAAAI
jgi:small subunit ribosomal protein S20